MELHPRGRLGINVFDTPRDVFEAFARIFPPLTTASASTTWLSFDAEGVAVTLHTPKLLEDEA